MNTTISEPQVPHPGLAKGQLCPLLFLVILLRALEGLGVFFLALVLSSVFYSILAKIDPVSEPSIL